MKAAFDAILRDLFALAITLGRSAGGRPLMTDGGPYKAADQILERRGKVG